MVRGPGSWRENDGVTAELMESVRQRPAPSPRPFVAWYSGYRQAGLRPGRHHGLPSPYLTLIFTLDDPLTVAAHPDPAQPAASYGSRDFGVRDPEGNRWSFGTYRGESRKA